MSFLRDHGHIVGAVESFQNPAADASSGAGTKAMQVLLGPGRRGHHHRSHRSARQAMLDETELKAVTGKSGAVGQVLKEYLAGRDH